MSLQTTRVFGEFQENVQSTKIRHLSILVPQLPKVIWNMFRGGTLGKARAPDKASRVRLYEHTVRDGALGIASLASEAVGI